MTSKLDMANLFDQLADYVDATEGRREQEKIASRTKLAEQAVEALEATSGQQVSDAVREKLAGLDEETLALIMGATKIAGGSPESLGGPADTAPTTKTASEGRDPILAWLDP